MSSLKPYRDAVVSELLATAANPKATRQDIHATLETVWQEAQAAGNVDLASRAEHVMLRVDELMNTMRGSITIAAAARKALDEMGVQLHEAVTQVEEIHTALRDIDTTYPGLHEFVSEVRSLEFDAIYNSGYHSDDPALDMINVAGLDLMHDEARLFFAWLVLPPMGRFRDLNRDEKRELSEFIVDFVRRVQQRQDCPSRDVLACQRPSCRRQSVSARRPDLPASCSASSIVMAGSARRWRPSGPAHRRSRSPEGRRQG